MRTKLLNTKAIWKKVQRGCRLAWSRLVDLGSIDPGSNPGSPTTFWVHLRTFQQIYPVALSSVPNNFRNLPLIHWMIRTYEAPEIARIAAPVHLKTGNSALTSQGIPTTQNEGVNMVIQAVLATRMVRKYFPEGIQSKNGIKDLAIPK